MFNKSIVPLVIVFLSAAALILVFRSQLTGLGFDWQVLSGGNLFIYLVTIVSMHLLTKGLNAPNTYAFLRNAYMGIMLKLFTCAAAVFIYIFVAGKGFSKSSLFACMGLYMIYTYLEFKGVLQNRKDRGHVDN